MSKRDDLIESTQALLWERGYEATSPRDIQRHSGAGQGSMYHHFASKEDLAQAALDNHERALWTATEQALTEPGMAGILAWLTLERDPLSGCRLGRLANELSIRHNPILRAPLDHYFDKLTKTLELRLEQALERGELQGHARPKPMATALAALVQGGYVLALARQDAAHMHDALDGARDLLSALSTDAS